VPTEVRPILEDLRARARNGTGSIALLSGESGIGKTYSAKEFAQNCVVAGDLVLTAKGRPNTPNPLYLIYEALADFFRTNQLTFGELRRLLIEFYPMLPRMATLIRPLLQRDADLRTLETGMPPGLAEASPYPHCLDFISKLARGRVTIFWIDDLQWSDRETLSFMMYVRDQLHNSRILWLLCVNPRREAIPSREDLEAAIAYLRSASDTGAVQLVEFQRYSLDSLPALISSMLGGPIDFSAVVLNELYAKTRGVPYLLRIFLDILRDERRLVLHNNVYRLGDAVDIPSLPSTLRTAIEMRLKRVYRLIPESRPVLEAASVFGERFEDTAIDAVLDLCNTYRLLAAIEDNHFLVRSFIEQQLWEFDHVAVRDFIYSALGVKAGQLHSKIAAHLVSIGSEDFAQLAYHMKMAGNIDAAISYQLKQAEEWLRQGFFDEARNLFDELWRMPQLKEHSDYQERTFDLEYSRALAYFYVSDYASCFQMLHEVSEACPSRSADPLLVLLRAKCLNKGSARSDFSSARISLETLLSRPEAHENKLLAGRVTAELVVSCAHLNDFSAAEKAFSEAERLLNRYEAPVEAAQLMRRACIFYEFELSEKILTRALEIFRRHRIDHEVVRVLNNLAVLYLEQGKRREAATSLFEALRQSARLGGFVQDYLLNNLALIRLQAGEPEAALEQLREAASCSKRTVCRLIILNNQAAVLLELGRIIAALELLDRLYPEALVVGEYIYITNIRLNRALALASLSRPCESLMELAQCTARYDGPLSCYYPLRLAVVRYVLGELGAIRETALRPERPEAMTIDMQFWGD
jgi:tetratricopeptide (TPR) repeat protein